MRAQEEAAKSPKSAPLGRHTIISRIPKDPSVRDGENDIAMRATQNPRRAPMTRPANPQPMTNSTLMDNPHRQIWQMQPPE